MVSCRIDPVHRHITCKFVCLKVCVVNFVITSIWRQYNPVGSELYERRDL